METYAQNHTMKPPNQFYPIHELVKCLLNWGKVITGYLTTSVLKIVDEPTSVISKDDWCSLCSTRHLRSL
jgi:hypothetical protein